MTPVYRICRKCGIAGESTTGEVQAVEMVPEIPGQLFMDGEEQEAPQVLNIINYR